MFNLKAYNLYKEQNNYDPKEIKKFLLLFFFITKNDFFFFSNKINVNNNQMKIEFIN